MVGRGQLEDALVLEPQTRPEPLVTLARQGKELRQSRRAFPGATSGVENVSSIRQLISADERHFLRPNGTRLRVEAANHRLVRHLLGLGIQVGHLSPRAKTTDAGRTLRVS